MSCVLVWLPFQNISSGMQEILPQLTKASLDYVAEEE